MRRKIMIFSGLNLQQQKFRFSDDDVDEMYREAPIKNGMFDYNEFTRSLLYVLPIKIKI